MLISGSAGPDGTPRLKWWGSLAALLTGKSMWEFERHLFRSGQCPAETELLFWLHPLWHAFTALSHFLHMSYISDVWLANSGRALVPRLHLRPKDTARPALAASPG